MSLPDLQTLSWQHERRPDQADSLRPTHVARVRIPNLTTVVSGKGGVGKTNVVANTAVAAAGLGARVLVVDGDIGLSNLDVLLGLSPVHTVVDVMLGRVELSDALVRGPKGVWVLPAGSGRHDLDVFEAGGTTHLLSRLSTIHEQFDLVLIDAGSGIGRVVTELGSAAGRALLVVAPEPTSFTDAYATCKTLWIENPDLVIDVLVNCSESEKEGREAHRHLDMMCRRFLDKDLELKGVFARDPRLRDAVVSQRAVVEQFPNAKISAHFVALAQELLRDAVSRQEELFQNPSPEPSEGEPTGSL